MFIGKVVLAKDKASQFGVAVGEEWVHAMGMRHGGSPAAGPRQGPQPGRPVCITRLYRNPELKGIEARLRDRRTAVCAIVEREFGVPIPRVGQDLQSVALDADDAANLGAVAGSPAGPIVRRCFDVRGRLMAVAENIHPGERFAYRLQWGK